jgi:glycosyltransferase involved in cell wall biosynthesis
VFKVCSIARGLVKRGHEITVLTADLGLRSRNGADLEVSRSQWGWRSQRDAIETIYLSTFARYRALTINPGVVGFSRTSLRRFDVVHFFGLYDLLGPAVSYFCRRQGIPYVVEPMGMYRPIVRNLELKRLYHRILGSPMIAGARFLVATSEQERRELIDGGVDPSRVVVRRNGIDRPEALPPRGEFRKKWDIAPECKVVLFLGRLVSKKSPDLLLEAFVNWRSNSPLGQNSILVIAGPDERDGFASRLRELAGKLALGQSALFAGPLYDEEKWQAYRDADVFVLPSQNENFGNTAAESAVCGTPVIVTDRCGIASLVGAAGLVIPHDALELERALRRILEDADFHQLCRKGCLQMADALSWEAPLDQTERLYRLCLSDQPIQEALA